MNTPLPSAPPAAVPVSTWEPLRQSLFRSIWIAALISNLGTWMQNVAGVWLVTTLSTSATLVALMQTATSLPVFLLSVPAGALADIVDRRRLLLMTQTFMAVIALILGVTTLTGLITAPLVVGFTFVLGIGSALNGPAWQTVTPEVVPRRLLTAAVTLNSVSVNLARAVGPALGGVIIAYYSPGYLFILNGLSFLITLRALWQWRRETVVSNVPVEDFFSALRAGLRYVRYSPSLYVILIRAFAFTFGASAMWALLSLVIARQLHLEAGTYGLMLSCIGAGAVTGALLQSRVGQWLSPNRRIIVSGLIFCLVNVSLATLTSVVLLSGVMFLAGLAWLLVLTSFNASVQLQLPKWVQARALSVYMLVFQGGMALGSLVWGAIGDEFGLPVALFGAAGWLLISMLLGIPFPIRPTESLNLSPAGGWGDPDVHTPVQFKNGPVVVMIEYHIEPADRAAFYAAIKPLQQLRLRDGASRIGIFTDVALPERQVEFFTVPTWGEHLRQHARFTLSDQVLEARVRQFHTGPERPKITHFVSSVVDESPMSEVTNFDNLVEQP
ncbi:MFS transporter [Spirosoma aerophilum]